MYYYLVNQNVSGKVYAPPDTKIYYYDCNFEPGSIIRDGYIINPVSKLQNIILNDCFIDGAIIEGTKIQGDTSIIRSTLLNCNFNQSSEPVFNTCNITYQGKYKYSLPILHGTFNNCSLVKCKIIEPVIYNKINMINSSLVYDDNTIIFPSKNCEWKLINTEVINAEISGDVKKD